MLVNRGRTAACTILHASLLALSGLALSGVAVPGLAAQTGPTVTIRILDGKTGEPLHPSNFLVRIDHRDEPYNETLKLNDDGSATVVLPESATSISIQGAYNASTELYLNCDADAARDGGMPLWYSIADIMKSGTVTPNLCFKRKYENRFKPAPKPGEFIFFARTPSWHEGVY